MNKKIWLIVGVAAVILLFWGNGSLLVTDSVESNYALTAKEMVRSGDWMSPQIYGRYWYDKPIFFYWLTALAFRIWGYTEFAARFFPALFGLGGLALLAWGSRKLYDEKTAVYSTVVLLSAIEFFLISKSVITDSTLFFFFSGVLLYFYLGYRDNKPVYWYAMYASAALAVLTKGPVGCLLPGLIICIFLTKQRGWAVLKRMKLGSGILFFLALSVPWYLYMYQVHGDIFLQTFFGTHNVLRATVSEHPRDNVWYYYLAVNSLALFPWTGVIPAAVWNWWKKGRKKIEEREVFLLIWAGTVFVFFQCMATKYITYTYPLLFPAAILLGRYVREQAAILQKKRYGIGMFAVYVLLAGAAYWLGHSGRLDVQAGYMIWAAIGMALCLWQWSRKDKNSVLEVGMGAVLIYLTLISSVAVPLSQERSGYSVAQDLNRTAGLTEQVGVLGSYPTSAVFYSDNRQLLKLVHEKELLAEKPQGFSWNDKNVMPMAAIEQNDCTILLVKKAEWERFKTLPESRDWQIDMTDRNWYVLKKTNGI